MDDFIKYLTASKILCKSSIRNYISRMKIMSSRNIDFTKGEDNARNSLLDSGLAKSYSRTLLNVM